LNFFAVIASCFCWFNSGNFASISVESRRLRRTSCCATPEDPANQSEPAIGSGYASAKRGLSRQQTARRAF
jgi:hypothetical protein